MLLILSFSFFLVSFTLALIQSNALRLRQFLGHQEFDYENFARSKFYKNLKEEYDIDHRKFNSVRKIIDYLDKQVEIQAIQGDTANYVQSLDSLIRKRFYHAQSFYNFTENWLLFLIALLFGSKLKAIVIPDDILSQHRRFATCSQQAMVFMEVLKQKTCQVRKVGWRGHFASEVFYQNAWHYFDTDLEVYFEKNQPIPSASELVRDKTLRQKAYKHKLKPKEIESIFNIPAPDYGKVNEFPAKNAKNLHLCTNWLSRFIWIFFLLFSLMLFFF